MSFLRRLVKTDPIVSELLRAGLNTYKKHFKAYVLLNITFIALFALILGPVSKLSEMKVFTDVFNLIDLFQSPLQKMFFYGLIGLIITIVTFYITFNQTLNSGELGLEIQTPWTAFNHFLVILTYNLMVLMYLLTWVFFLRILFVILTFNSLQYSLGIQDSYAMIFMILFFVTVMLIAFFLFVVKFSYYIYMLDEFKVPTQALDPIIFSFGLLFGLLIVFLDFIMVINPSLWEVSIIISYLTPGTVIMPILGYSMAHLKVASTVLGFEPLMVHDEPSAT